MTSSDIVLTGVAEGDADIDVAGVAGAGVSPSSCNWGEGPVMGVLAGGAVLGQGPI